jgi:proteic killer suppression protein
MIQSFASKETEAVFFQRRSAKLPPEIQERALVKLMLLHAAESERDLTQPPSNHFERLRGDWRGFGSIRINRQWRICFRFENGNAYDVSITDYH